MIILYPGFLFILFVIAARHAARVRARLRNAMIFRHLGLIVRQNLPLPQALFLAASNEQGQTERVLSRCRILVQQGVSLADALANAHPRCPGLPLSILRAAERAGTLPSALLELVPRMEAEVARHRSDQRYRATYSIATLLVCVLVFLSVSYYVGPRLVTIFQDFDTDTSLIFNDLLVRNLVTERPATFAGWLIRITMLMPILLVLFWVIRWLWRLSPRRAERVGWHNEILDTCRWYLWPLSRMTRMRAWEASLSTIRLAIAAGWPLSDAVAHASGLDVNVCLRKRLTAWATRLRAGELPPVAAQSVGAPDIVVRALSIGVRDGDLDAPLAYAQSYLGAFVSRWRALAVHVFWPTVTFVLAFMTGSVAYALMSAMKKLIDKCCELVV